MHVPILVHQETLTSVRVEGGTDTGTRDVGTVMPGGSVKFGVAIACVINPRRTCAARVTVLGLCVCLLLNISLFHVIIRATNDTNLLSGG